MSGQATHRAKLHPQLEQHNHSLPTCLHNGSYARLQMLVCRSTPFLYRRCGFWGRAGPRTTWVVRGRRLLTALRRLRACGRGAWASRPLNAASTPSAARCLCAVQTVVGVQSARPDTIGCDDRDTIEDNSLHLDDITVDIVDAPLWRTMTPIGLTVGLNQAARHRGVFCLNAHGLGARSEGHNRDVEFRQCRCSRPRS